MTPLLPLTYDATFRLTALAISLWCTLTSLEMFVALPAFRPGRALGIDIAGLRLSRLRRPPWSRLFAPRALSSLAGLRLAAGIGLPFAPDVAIGVALLVVLVGCTALLSIATEGSDGADKIAIVACVAAVLIGLGLLLDDRLLCIAGVAWGAGQLTIAYVTSGAAKLSLRVWRDGTAVRAAMTSYRSGHPVAAAIVRHRSVALALGWSVILIEILFPLALVAPMPVALSILAIFVVFHFATAIVMGLNTYPWGFMSAYPCALLANALVNAALGLSH